MTIFFTVMENDSDKDVPAVAVFESVNNRQGAERFVARHSVLYPGRFTIKPYKTKD